MPLSDLGDFKNALDKIKDASRIIWDKQQHVHYTGHGIKHSETIISKLTILLTDQSMESLTPVETFILKSACYLHDIGMQCADSDLLGGVCKIDKNASYPFSPEMLETIRANHAELSYQMINEKLKSTFERIDYRIVDAIARVSRAHSQNKEKYKIDCPKNDKGIPEGGAKLQLLALLLRLGDSLDADTNRCNMGKFIEFADRLPVASQAHFWKHYFVANVDEKNGLIQFHYTIPAVYEKAGPGIQKMAEEHTREHTDDLDGIWERDVIRIKVTDSEFHDDTAEPPYKMSEDVLEFFKSYGDGGGSSPFEIPEEYKDWINNRCYKMDIDKLVNSRDSGMISLTLPEIFVPLYTNSLKREKSADSDEAMDGNEPGDIERHITEKEYLLIEGQAGSGKTTLLKHIAYTIIQDSNEEGFNGYLPVLMFLRDFSSMEPVSGVAGTPLAQTLLSLYCKETGNGIDMALIERFCKSGKVIFLIDGLDEIEPGFRKKIVESFADFRAHYKSKQGESPKLVFSGRPHGVDATVKKYFGDNHLYINSLNLEQVRLFVDKWHKVDAELQAKGTTAEGMFSEIKSHPEIEKLISTPLMLTAACILYHYDRKLPEQRAELFERFINNLICKKFDNDTEVLDFLMKLAFDAHKARITDFDRDFAIKILQDIIPKEEKETENHYSSRLGSEFDKIEQNCGILKLENGQYSFWHLNFQEFLTAREIVAHSLNFADAVAGYWEDDWYKEVVELFIGHLSNSSMAQANKIVKDELLKADISPFRRWRLACRALLNAYQKMRERPTLDVARKCMESIFQEEAPPKIWADAGEILGLLGDHRDLKEFVRIEAGQYPYQEGFEEIKEFEISRYPVTNQWFKKFVDADGYREEGRKYWSDDGRKWLEDGNVEYPAFWHDPNWNCPNSPVVGVSWYEAEAFCNWLTEVSKDGYCYRLPHENEWEAAARGRVGREYPWGKLAENRCNYDENIGRTSSVGIFLKGNTPDTGISDLAGNVWEWCADWFDGRGDDRVLRGGGWFINARSVRSASQYWYGPGDRFDAVGFRLSRGQKKEKQE